MNYLKLQDEYVKGKQVICAATLLSAVGGFILDAITYYSIYSNTQIVLQTISVLLCLMAIVLYSINKVRFYVLSYGLVSYGIILNILFTTIFIHTFRSFETFSEANILSRDIFFIVLFITLSGFILGRIHLIIQGFLLIGLILFFVFIKRDVFFKANAAIYLTSAIGFVSVLYFLVGTLNRLIQGLSHWISRTNALQAHEQIKNQKLLLYQDTLLGISKDKAFLKDDISDLFGKICSTASRILNTSRVSIWMLEDNNLKLVRKHLFESASNNSEQFELRQQDFPHYFEALQGSPYILASEAATHPQTSEFQDIYLKPLNIISMLDCSIVLDGAVIGVICCEHQLEKREWNTEDVLFVQSLSEHISIAFKNREIKNLLSQVQYQNIELIEKANEIETMNEELSSVNEELSTLNDTLDATVKRRTEELELQNKQLTEYAFINSHLLRAPLARILGLAKLIAANTATLGNQELVNALIHSSGELDSIIRKISDILYDGNNLSRSDVQVIIDRNITKNL